MGRNSERLNQYIRISVICDGIKNNSSYQEIQERLQYLPGSTREGLGVVSVINTKRVLSSIPFITEIHETERFSYQDVVLKHDLEISCEEISGISVQVKSSICGVLDFYKNFDKDHFKAQEILTKRKLIVLDGSLPDNVIQKSFLDQFDYIKRYHQGQS